MRNWLTKGNVTKKQRYDNILYAVPLAVLAGLGVFGIVCVVLLLLGRFETVLIWLIGGLLSILAAGLTVTSLSKVSLPPRSKGTITIDIVVLLGVLAWGVFNVFFTSQHVITNRDPGVYATAASWLSTHDNLLIKDEADIDPQTPGVTTGSMGYWSYQPTGGMIYAQGQHLLPALMGAVGKLVGPVQVLHVSIVFGVTALLAVFCFARLAVAARWAMGATAVMAAALPLIYFSRDSYTEPLALTVTFGGLAFLWLAQKHERILFWVMAGLLLGSGALARIDGYLALIGVAAFVGIYVIVNSTAKKPVRQYGGVAAFIGAIMVPCILGWLDLVILSPHYYGDVLKLMQQEIAAIIGVLAVSAAGVWYARSHAKRLTSLVNQYRVVISFAVPVMLLAVMAVLSSRFLWMQGKNPTSPLFDGRSYAEVSTFWNEWYLGSAIMVLGILGTGLIVHRVLARKSLSLLTPALLVVCSTALIYFLKPSIFPDQIWASRRMLPIVMPGLVIFAMYAVAFVETRLSGATPRWARTGVVGAGLALLVLTPLQVSAPFIRHGDTVQFAYIEGVCKNVSATSTVVWIGKGATNALQATRTYCGTQAYGFEQMPSREVLRNVASDIGEKNKETIIAVNSDEVPLLLSDEQAVFSPVSTVRFNRMQSTLNGPPRASDQVLAGVSLARLTEQGRFVSHKN